MRARITSPKLFHFVERRWEREMRERRTNQKLFWSWFQELRGSGGGERQLRGWKFWVGVIELRFHQLWKIKYKMLNPDPTRIPSTHPLTLYQHRAQSIHRWFNIPKFFNEISLWRYNAPRVWKHKVTKVVRAWYSRCLMGKAFLFHVYQWAMIIMIIIIIMMIIMF